MTNRLPYLAIAAALLLPSAAQAQAQEIAVGHTGARSVPLDAAKLAALPTADVTLTYGTPPTPHTFQGPLLWTILTTTGAADPARHADAVRQILYVTGADHYVAVIAAGELSPEFENKQVILALTQDGHPLPHPRVVIPGDKRGGRGVHDVVRLQLEELPKTTP